MLVYVCVETIIHQRRDFNVSIIIDIRIRRCLAQKYSTLAGQPSSFSIQPLSMVALLYCLSCSGPLNTFLLALDVGSPAVHNRASSAVEQ